MPHGRRTVKDVLVEDTLLIVESFGLWGNKSFTNFDPHLLGRLTRFLSGFSRIRLRGFPLQE
jgi:hypothetical protein